MDIPGAFARPGCVARCCRDVLDELTFDPLFERRDENLDAILAPADLTMLLLRDQEWGNDTPRTERARVLAKEVTALSETRVLHMLDRLDLCRDKFTNVRLTPDEEPTDETIIGVARTTCIGCGQKLPEHSVTKATDPHRGDGEEYSRRKRVRPDFSTMKVLSRRGEVVAKRYYKRCAGCGLMHYGDHAERREPPPEGGTCQPVKTEHFMRGACAANHGRASLLSLPRRYIDFTEGRVFQGTRDMAVDTYLLEVMGNIVFNSALSYSATMKLIDDNIIGEETLVPHYQTVKLIFERYQVLKMIRDCSNPTRFEQLRGFRAVRIDPQQDRAFETRNFLEVMTDSTWLVWLEAETLPDGELGSYIRHWIQHECVSKADNPKLCVACGVTTPYSERASFRGRGPTAQVLRVVDGGMKIWRFVCIHCWKGRRRKKTTCELGNLAGHSARLSGPKNVAPPAGAAANAQPAVATVAAEALGEPVLPDAPPLFQRTAERIEEGDRTADDALAGGAHVMDGEGPSDEESDVASEDDADDDLTEEQQKEGYGKIAKIHGIKGAKGRREVAPARHPKAPSTQLRRLDRPATHHFPTQPCAQVLVEWVGWPDEEDRGWETANELDRRCQRWIEAMHQEKRSFPWYVCERPPGPMGTRSRPNYTYFEPRMWMKVASTKDEDAVECNTVKDRKELTRSRRLCGVFFQLTMCGVLHNVHEMYRSEGKTMVLLALASTVFHCWEQGIELSMAELSVSASI